MNPAYGTYLQTDSDLVDVVHKFTKRIKTRISAFETPAQVPPHILTQPLCEMLWRVVGYVMHGVIELEDEANMPVPKEGSGMIRMLLHTNTQLSNKLNELRRSYLKELSQHRDNQRKLSAVAARAVASLQEQPIMFYEPLEYVLDDNTKDFVRETVAERIKLEMRAGFNSGDDDNAEMMAYIKELEEERNQLKDELSTCQDSLKRSEEQMKTVSNREKQQREEIRVLKDNVKEGKEKIGE